MKTIVAAFDHPDAAEQAVRALFVHGFTEKAIRVASPADPGELGRHPLLAEMSTAEAGAGTEGLPQGLGMLGVPAPDAERYAQTVRRGGTLVVLTVREPSVEDAAMILALHAPIEPYDGVPPTGPPAHERSPPEAVLDSSR